MTNRNRLLAWLCPALPTLASVALLAACRFDEGYQYDLRYPASLIIQNTTESSMHTVSVAGNADADSTFVLNQEAVPAGGSIAIRVSEPVYEDLVDGHFALRLVCAGAAPAEFPGTALSRKPLRDADHWQVTVTVANCGPGATTDRHGGASAGKAQVAP